MKVQTEFYHAAHISLTHGWTAHHGPHSFYSLTAGIISPNFEVRSLNLQLTHFPGSHTGQKIFKFIKDYQQLENTYEKNSKHSGRQCCKYEGSNAGKWNGWNLLRMHNSHITAVHSTKVI